MSIYVLINGEYSDWQIMGYTKSEEEAKRICHYENSKYKTSDVWYDDWYYEEVEEYTEIVPKGKPCVVLPKSFYYEPGSGWKEDWSYRTIAYMSEEEAHKDIRYCQFVEPDNKLDSKGYWGAVCDVIIHKCITDITDDDHKKAFKIAQDRLYKTVAEKNLQEKLPPPKKYIHYGKFFQVGLVWYLIEHKVECGNKPSQMNDFVVSKVGGKNTMQTYAILDTDDKNEGKKALYDRFAKYSNRVGSLSIGGKLDEEDT